MKVGRRQIIQKIKEIDQQDQEQLKYNKNEAKTLLAIAYITHFHTKKLFNLKRENFEVKKNQLIIYGFGKNITINKDDELAQIIIPYIKQKMPERFIFRYFRSKTTKKINNKKYKSYYSTYQYYLKKWFGLKKITPKDLM